MVYHGSPFGVDGVLSIAPISWHNLSVLTTFPIYYAIRMRNHRVIKGNVVVHRLAWTGSTRPVKHHCFAHLHQVEPFLNVLRMLYGRVRLPDQGTETTSKIKKKDGDERSDTEDKMVHPRGRWQSRAR